MIAFACVIGEPALYGPFAERGIRRVAEPDSQVLALGTPRRPGDAAPHWGARIHILNLILDRAATCEDLEALVILDEQTEILDTEFCSKLRAALSDPSVAVVGCAGGAGVRSIAWWEARKTYASSVYRPADLEGAEFPGLVPDGWTGSQAPGRGPGEVDTVDGVLMALSPWAVNNVRFDESLGPRYGYDVDFCLQARAAGRKVVVADVSVAHGYPLGVIDDIERWTEAHMRASEKWDGRLPVSARHPDWRRRARRAEGEAAAAELLTAGRVYALHALERVQEREMSEATGALSWRITKPLRQLNAFVSAAGTRPARREASDPD